MNIELDDRDRRLLALAIQGLCMRQGPSVFNLALPLAEKLGVIEFLEEYLKSWNAYADAKKKDC